MTPSDEQLMAQTAQGDREAFDALAVRYAGRLRRAAARVLPDGGLAILKNLEDLKLSFLGQITIQ